MEIKKKLNKWFIEDSTLGILKSKQILVDDEFNDFNIWNKISYFILFSVMRFIYNLGINLMTSMVIGIVYIINAFWIGTPTLNLMNNIQYIKTEFPIFISTGDEITYFIVVTLFWLLIIQTIYFISRIIVNLTSFIYYKIK